MCVCDLFCFIFLLRHITPINNPEVVFVPWTNLRLRRKCHFQYSFRAAQIARFTWPTWGPPGSCRPQVGPMLAPWPLLSWWCYQSRAGLRVFNEFGKISHASMRAVVMPTLPSLASLHNVLITISGATNDGKVGVITTLEFQCTGWL